MTRKENIEHNITLTFDFIRKVIDDPSILDKLPNGSVIEFVEKDFSILEKAKKNGRHKYVRVKNEFEVIS